MTTLLKISITKRWLYFLFVFIVHDLFAQDDLKNRADSFPVKGFYKTYKDFLSNKPSVILDFSTELIYAGKGDSTIVAAKYSLPDSLDHFGDVWGFSDGRNVFVANGTLFAMKYWKLQCKGPNPYFYYFHREISLFPGIGNIISLATTATLPPECTLMFIDKDGRPQNTFRYKLKQLFRDNPPLLKEFKNEDPDLLYNNVIIKYITRYNDAK